MGAVASLLLLATAISAFTVWIVAIVKWDGRRPCEPENCETCPYKGTGCKPEEQSKNTTTQSNKKGNHT